MSSPLLGDSDVLAEVLAERDMLRDDRDKWGRYAAKLTEELQAMTRARDICKQQATDAGERWQGVLTWLRDHHPEVYEEAMHADA